MPNLIWFRRRKTVTETGWWSISSRNETSLKSEESWTKDRQRTKGRTNIGPQEAFLSPGMSGKIPRLHRKSLSKLYTLSGPRYSLGSLGFLFQFFLLKTDNKNLGHWASLFGPESDILWTKEWRPLNLSSCTRRAPICCCERCYRLRGRWRWKTGPDVFVPRHSVEWPESKLFFTFHSNDMHLSAFDPECVRKQRKETRFTSTLFKIHNMGVRSRGQIRTSSYRAWERHRRAIL